MFGRTVAKPAGPNSPSALGLGCVALFLLPFAGVGVVTAGMAVQRLTQGNWREALFFMLFAITFGGIGLGGLTLTLAGRRKLEEQEALKARHPEEPWLWQKDWASGRVEDAGRLTMWASWVFAIFWNLVSVPAGFVGVQAALQEGNKAALAALLFPMVGVALLVWAIRTTVRHHKYGVSRLELWTIPGVIGHTIAGTVRVTTVLQPGDGFLTTLSCVRRVTTDSGKDSSTTESILWQEERYIKGEPSRDAAGLGTRIPIAFRLPADSQACDANDPDNRILWRLKLSASVRGIDYESIFEVPVFRTAESDRPLTAEEERLTQDQLVTADYRQPADSRIAVTTNRRGTEVEFPAARNPGAAIGSTVFMLLWTGIVVALIYFDTPVLFPIVFGLFEVLLIYGTLQLWLGVSRVTVEAGMLSVATGYLYPSAERKLAATEIADVTAAIGMQAGSTPYYDVVILRKNGKKVIAGRSLCDKREAEWLAATIKERLGLLPTLQETNAPAARDSRSR
jgi:hypothetical protein